MAKKPTKANQKSGAARQRPEKSRLGGRWKAVRQANFAKRYAAAALMALLLSAILWAVLGANLHNLNADQSANSFLFENVSTFHGASWPGQHSFLLKWPLFLLIRFLGYSTGSFTLFTVLTVLATVGGLAALLGRIERRPLVLGTLYLALASVLMAIPTMPYAGGLLPLNMAMLTTRNVEYLVYIVSLVLLLRAPKILSRRFGLATLVLALLIASDKLFLTLSAGGALLGLIVYGVAGRRDAAKLCLRWLAGGAAAAFTAAAGLALINALGVTHIVNQTGGGPYGVIRSLHDALLGSIHAVLAVFTNFGANPAFDALKLRDIPRRAFSGLAGAGGLAFVVNAAVLLAASYAAWHLIKTGWSKPRRPKKAALSGKIALATMLIWSSLAAMLAFIGTKHYYAVDARYLAVLLFAAFISLAAHVSNQKLWPAGKLLALGSVLALSLAAGMLSALQTYHKQKAALADVGSRNQTIAQILAQHKVDVLVGDYWRVVPVKLQAQGAPLGIMPLENCTQPRDILSSKKWQPDLSARSFAYLLTQSGNLTDYPSCSLESIVSAYGRPSSSVLIAGSLRQPAEQLLFYDHGARNSAPATAPKSPSSVLTVPLDELPHTDCGQQTDMNIVAHQDDDLLFMNPAILQAMHKQRCQRTVYLTAGDAGYGRFYWLGRERGSEAAYDYMDGPGNDIWVSRVVKLSDNAYATVANPRGNSKLSLIFLHLPDGDIGGSGFKDSGYVSLRKLDDGRIKTIGSVDGQSSYTARQLVVALKQLMEIYEPTLVRTQANYIGKKYPDHSDHLAVGSFAKRAFSLYEAGHANDPIKPSLRFYIGYPVHGLPPNVFGQDLRQKEAAFFAYGTFDPGVCAGLKQCGRGSAYPAYLTRMYQSPY